MYKNTLFLLSITANFAAHTLCANEQPTGTLINTIRQIFSTKEQITPTTPIVLRHTKLTAIFPGPIFFKHKIYFGKDKSGNPCYRTIEEHAQNNPAFGDVTLAEYGQPNSLCPNGTIFKHDTFSHTFSPNISQKNLGSTIFLADIVRHGGIWCPEQKTIISGTQDGSNCAKLTKEFEKQQDAALAQLFK